MSNLRHRSLHSQFAGTENHTEPHLFDTASTAEAQATTEASPWEETWGTKSTILLSQGLLITILVLMILCACGRKHYRRMNLIAIQELTTIRIESEVRGRSREVSNDRNSRDGEENEEQIRLHRTMRLLASPFRYIDRLMNELITSSSTEYEYYRRILERMEREQEERREGAEERTERLMNAFLKGQCVWEIDDKHFIPPFSLEKPVEFPNNFDVEIEADIGNCLKDSMGTDSKCTEMIEKDRVSVETGSKDASVVEKEAASKETSTCNELSHVDQGLENDEKNVVENGETPSKSPDFNHPSSLTAEPNTDPVNRTEEKLPVSTLFDDTPGYLYLHLSNRNRIRANSTVSSPTTFETTSMPTSPSTSSLPSHNKSDNHQRTIPNQCAICLCDYAKGDTVVLSTNSSCSHAFHQECIVEWLVKMQDGTPCPCCRQTFVELENAENARETRDERREMSEEELGRLRRHIQLGFQRGRAFDVSVIRW